MIYINDNWESASTLNKCLNLVREYNKELATKIAELLPVHTDKEYDELERELKKSDDYLRDAEDEVDRLQEQVDDLNEEVSDLEHLLKEGKYRKKKLNSQQMNLEIGQFSNTEILKEKDMLLQNSTGWIYLNILDTK